MKPDCENQSNKIKLNTNIFIKNISLITDDKV